MLPCSHAANCSHAALLPSAALHPSAAMRLPLKAEKPRSLEAPGGLIAEAPEAGDLKAWESGSLGKGWEAKIMEGLEFLSLDRRVVNVILLK